MGVKETPVIPKNFYLKREGPARKGPVRMDFFFKITSSRSDICLKAPRGLIRTESLILAQDERWRRA